MAVVLAVPPWPQDLVYHNFADTRAFFGIPNFWNVVSNAAFLIVGVAGLRDDPLMAAGLILTAFGSGYYHWSPSSQTFFGDRLPMTIVFMAFYAAFLDDRLNIRRARWPLVILGVASVVWWRWTDDLRPYIMVQFFPIVSLPFLLYFCPASGTSRRRSWRRATLRSTPPEWEDTP